MLSVGKFNSMVSLAAFFPFKSAQGALENMNAISEGEFIVCFLLRSNKLSSAVMMLHNLSIH